MLCLLFLRLWIRVWRDAEPQTRARSLARSLFRFLVRWSPPVDGRGPLFHWTCRKCVAAAAAARSPLHHCHNPGTGQHPKLERRRHGSGGSDGSKGRQQRISYGRPSPPVFFCFSVCLDNLTLSLDRALALSLSLSDSLASLLSVSPLCSSHPIDLPALRARW